MKKEIITALLAVGMTLQIAGCDVAETTDTTVEETTETTATAETTTEASEETTTETTEKIVYGHLEITTFLPDGSSYVSGATDFDEKGRSVYSVKYQPDGSIISYTECGYDENDNKIKDAQFFYHPDGQVGKHEMITEYDSEGKKVRDIITVTTGDSVNEYYQEYDYDDNGLQVEGRSVQSDGTVTCTVNFEYDENGNNIKQYAYDENGGFLYHDEFEYDENGKQVLQNCFDEDGNIYYYIESERDSEGNLTSFKIVYPGKGLISQWDQYEYTEDGKKSKVTNHDKEGNVSLVSEYTYNQYGYINEKILYDGEGNEISTSKYVYS